MFKNSILLILQHAICHFLLSGCFLPVSFFSLIWRELPTDIKLVNNYTNSRRRIRNIRLSPRVHWHVPTAVGHSPSLKYIHLHHMFQRTTSAPVSLSLWWAASAWSSSICCSHSVSYTMWASLVHDIFQTVKAEFETENAIVNITRCRIYFRTSQYTAPTVTFQTHCSLWFIVLWFTFWQTQWTTLVCGQTSKLFGSWHVSS